MLRALAARAAVPQTLPSRLPARPAQLAGAVLSGRWASTGSDSARVVAYPGSPGSLSNIGAKQFFKGRANVTLQGVDTIVGTFDAVSKGEVDFGIVPLENSTSGSVQIVSDMLLQHDVVIAGDLGIHEKYCLCVKPGVDLSAIRRVTSHPIILDACDQFINQKLPKGQDRVAAVTTCEAAASLGQSDSMDTATIGTHEAATLHGLKVLATDIGNDVHAETRYALIRRAEDTHLTWSMPTHLQTSNAITKHSIALAVKNTPGGIFKLLSCWALRDLNIVRLESRPLCNRKISGVIPGVRVWDHIYYIDSTIPAHQTKEESEQLWNSIREFSSWQRDFGKYTSLVSRTEKKAKTFDEIYENFTWG